MQRIIMNIIEETWYLCAVIYSKFSPFLINHFGIDKLGYFLRRIRQPRILTVGPLRFHLDPEVSTCFGMMIGGRFNEEETHKLLRKILERNEKLDLFIDVGANIGEFVVTVASSNKVKNVIGFEPNPACVSSCLKSVELNGVKNVKLVQAILTDSRKAVTFNLTGRDAHLHSIFDQPLSGSEVIYSSTIDKEIQAVNAAAVLKIDVEGAELLVLKGGQKFIGKNHPFIIFEYNQISRRHFSLDDMRKVLPEGYEIFRIRSEDGVLDRNLSKTWNCAAVHKKSPFSSILGELVK